LKDKKKEGKLENMALTCRLTRHKMSLH